MKRNNKSTYVLQCSVLMPPLRNSTNTNWIALATVAFQKSQELNTCALCLVAKSEKRDSQSAAESAECQSQKLRSLPLGRCVTFTRSHVRLPSRRDATLEALFSLPEQPKTHGLARFVKGLKMESGLTFNRQPLTFCLFTLTLYSWDDIPITSTDPLPPCKMQAHHYFPNVYIDLAYSNTKYLLYTSSFNYMISTYFKRRNGANYDKVKQQLKLYLLYKLQFSFYNCLQTTNQQI